MGAAGTCRYTFRLLKQAMAQASHFSDLTIVVGSGNLHKVEEIAVALGALVDPEGRRVCVEGKQGLPPGPEPNETGATFQENSLIKAMGYAALAMILPPARRPRWVLADDSGLSVDALGGAPGVRSARYAGEDASSDDNNRRLLEALWQVPEGHRGAEFVCVLSLVEIPRDLETSTREVLSAEGRCRGEILRGQAGTGGFGYDPLFFVPSLGKTFAQITTEEKNAQSHRGKALQRFRSGLEEILKRLSEES